MNQRQPINLVMFNMSRYADWQNGIANRNYHVVQNLAKNESVNKIICIDFLPFNWRKALKTYIYDQIFRDTQGTVIYGDLTSRCWKISSKILVYSTIDSVINPNKISSELNTILKKEQMTDNLVVWNYNPLFTDYFNKFEQAFYVFDAVDDWLSHNSYRKQQKILKGNYETIRAKSDLIFTVSDFLRTELFNSQTNAFWLPNAVDLEFFQKEKNSHPLLQKLAHPIIGFLGILQSRIDTQLLQYLAANNPQMSIVLAGPVWPDFPKQELVKFKNIHFIGPIKHWEIPQLYNGFDVGIIPYKTNKFVKSTDPMKFYEYLAANLPVISTPVPGTERFGELVQVAPSPEQFQEAVLQVQNTDKGLLASERLKLLQNNTWQHRIEQMLDLIYSKMN